MKLSSLQSSNDDRLHSPGHYSDRSSLQSSQPQKLSHLAKIGMPGNQKHPKWVNASNNTPSILCSQNNTPQEGYGRLQVTKALSSKFQSSNYEISTNNFGKFELRKIQNLPVQKANKHYSALFFELATKKYC